MKIASLDFGFVTRSDALEKAYSHSYQYPEVVLSVLTAVFASYCAFEIITRRGDDARWIAIGALMLGLGTWAMHFVGMTAFRLDCAVSYNPGVTLASVIPG